MASEHPEVPFYDVMIVGGGPAGSSAAYFLGEAGKRVLVLEKERLPRYKTCGGGLSVEFLQEQFPFSFASIVKEKVSSITYQFYGLEATIPVSNGSIGMVMREDLDPFLLSHARAEVIQQAEVKQVLEQDDRVMVETQDGRWYAAAYLIGADGANSRVARALGLRRDRTLAAAIEAEVPVPPEVKQRFEHKMVFIFGEIRNGYLWIFSKPDHLSVGIGALRPKPGVLQKTLRRVMAKYRISLAGVQLHGHPIPIYTRRERVAGKRSLLVGDAAGFVDPLSGEGIRFAIKSGRLAAETILSGHPERYPNKVHRSIGFSHSLTVPIAFLFYAFELPFLLFGAPNPFSTHGILEMLSDRMNVIGFIAYSMCTLPIFLGTELAAGFLSLVGKGDLSNQFRALIYPEPVEQAYRSDQQNFVR